MKRTMALAGAALALGVLVGCEDKQAEAQQNQRLDVLNTDLFQVRNEVDALRSENQELKRKIDLVVDWLKKRQAEAAKVRAADAGTTEDKPRTTKPRSAVNK